MCTQVCVFPCVEKGGRLLCTVSTPFQSPLECWSRVAMETLTPGSRCFSRGASFYPVIHSAESMRTKTHTHSFTHLILSMPRNNLGFLKRILL